MSAGTLLGWMPAADSNCGYIGITEDATITYSVYSDSETHGTAQFKALGYETKQKCTIKIPFKPKTLPVKREPEQPIASAREGEYPDWQGPLADRGII